MRVTIKKHFDYLTPLSEAKTQQELVEIATIKYPKACSILETDAGFFARVVSELKQYEVWKALGFASFEDFCVTEFKKTLDEVEGIVGSVKLLTSSGVERPTLRQVTKTQAILQRREQYPNETQQEIADEIGVSRQFVTQVLASKSSDSELLLAIPGWIKGNTDRATFKKLSAADQEKVRKAGKGSLRGIAIAAGVVKVPTVLEQLKRLWAKATPTERRQFLSEVACP
ncbi:hypothetical protein EBZ39_13575 [bacterium]|nr:hypothetical protein [bacterium]